MNFTITEVQTTCIVLMGLTTLILAFSLPRHIQAGKTIDHARKLLSYGTSLVILHFIIQYALHKAMTPQAEVRTFINMLFGIPISGYFNLSVLYLQRRGRIRKKEWLFFPAMYLFSILVPIICYFIIDNRTYGLTISTIIMSILYAITLYYANFLEIREFIIIRNTIKNEGDKSLEMLLRWTQWSILYMIFTGIYMPFMAFNENLLYRSIYGLITISAAFFYIFSFIGYYLNSNTLLFELGKKKSEKNNDEKIRLSEEKMDQIGQSLDKLVLSKFHLKIGITQKDVAAELGISRVALNAYLQNTDYKKFNNWLMCLRLEEAKRLLLQHPDWTNETIAQECGFSNRAYFQSQFSEHVGMSPLKWIKENQTRVLKEPTSK